MRGDSTPRAGKEALDDLARWGAPAEVQQAWAGAADAEPEAFGVWPQNWNTLRAFCAVSTQWRVAGTMTGLTVLGLDYAGVRAGLKAARIKLTEVEWRGLQLMENAASAALNERAA